MPSIKPEVNKRARDKWYRINKSHQISKQNERRKELMVWFTEYKRSLNCEDCHCSFEHNPEWIDFHHLDPSSKEGVANQMVKSSKKRLIGELAKCVPLCANCHRTRHAIEKLQRE